MYTRRKHSPEHAPRRVRGYVSAALVFVVTIALAACTDQPETDEFSADTAGAITGDTTGMMAETPEADTIDVELSSYEIDMSGTLPAGTHVFKVENTGDTEHGFEIEGQGTEFAVESIPPGETETLEADLQPGSYVVYCPVGNHRQQGMEMTLTVERAGSTVPAY